MPARSVPLPPVPVTHSATAALPPAVEQHLAIHFWPLVVDVPNWRVRLAHLDGILSRYRGGQTDEIGRARLTMNRELITSLLEQVADREIGCIEAAVVYRLAVHSGWQLAAARFMCGVDDAALGAVVEAHPSIARLTMATVEFETLDAAQ